MASPRTIRKRIVSIRNINKITRTMERVAQSRALKLQNRLVGSRSFRDRVAHHISACVRGDPMAHTGLTEHPLCVSRKKAGKTLLVVITSNRGLCGGYNSRVLLAARRRARELEASGGVPILVVIGRRGTNAFRYAGRTVEQSIGDVDEATPYTRWNEVMSGIMARFESREIDTVEVVSMRYRTRAVQEAAVTPVLPFVVESRSPAAPGAEPLYKVEPSQESFLGEAVALAVRSELTCMLVEALLSEQIQRTMAMHNATDSAEGMAKKLTRAYNRARQAQVTAEMMEIVGGSQRAVEE